VCPDVISGERNPQRGSAICRSRIGNSNATSDWRRNSDDVRILSGDGIRRIEENADSRFKNRDTEDALSLLAKDKSFNSRQADALSSAKCFLAAFPCR